MNKNINNYNEKEVKNKLKNFKEDSDYSVSREGEKKKYNFHNNFLKDIMGDNWTTVYEAAENWDSDNYNHHREAAEYVSKNIGESGNRGRVAYRYEHKINKDASGYREWSWGENFFRDGYKHSWTLRAGPSSNFKNNFLAPVDEVENHRRNLEKFRNERKMLERDIENLRLHEGNDYEVKQKIRKFAEQINEINDKIRYHEDWLARNANNNSELTRYHKLRAEWGGKPSIPNLGCWVCGKLIAIPHDDHYYCKNDGEDFCSVDCHKKVQHYHSGCEEIVHSKDKHDVNLVKKDNNRSESDLAQENRELKQQLAEVKNQLTEVLEELKKLRNNSTGQNNAELDQQIDYNEKLIRNVEEVPEAEVKEQLQKSQALLEKGVSVSVPQPKKDNLGSSSLPYLIGGSVLVVSAGIIGYFLLKKNKKK